MEERKNGGTAEWGIPQPKREAQYSKRKYVPA